jgi:hypothetical protein
MRPVPDISGKSKLFLSGTGSFQFARQREVAAKLRRLFVFAGVSMSGVVQAELFGSLCALLIVAETPDLFVSQITQSWRGLSMFCPAQALATV